MKYSVKKMCVAAWLFTVDTSVQGCLRSVNLTFNELNGAILSHEMYIIFL